MTGRPSSGLGHVAGMVAMAAAMIGCGYRLAHAPVDPLGPFVVVSGPVHVPSTAALAAAEEGARAELSRAGQLSPSSAGGSLEIEVLRIEEASEAAGLDNGVPLARGLRITVTGRARLRGEGRHEVQRDTGDLRVAEVVAPAGAPAWVLGREEAERTAARRLGEALVRRLLGVAEPGEP